MSPTLLDGILEKHDGPEPRVLVEDVRSILLTVIQPDTEGSGESVALIANKAAVSTRTVYRVLSEKPDKPSISLELADKLCMAADSNVNRCRFVYPDGRITSAI